MADKYLYAHWWMGNNFGDMLTPFLIERIGRRRAVWVNLAEECSRPLEEVYLVVGSILWVDTTNSIVWGSGILNQDHEVKKPKEIRAVRGKITRARLVDSGYDCPEVYGDPALLLPRFYKIKTKVKYPIGIVAHFVDLAKMFGFYGDDDNVKLISVTDPVEKVIADICSCERIASSSLHGLIAADAYGIPSLRLEVRVRPGKEIRFDDYWSSVGVEPYEAFPLRQKVPVEEIIKAVKQRPVTPDLDRLLEACPFYLPERFHD